MADGASNRYVADSVAELGELGLVKEALTEIKANGSPLLFKAYIINGSEVFFGFSPVAKHAVRIKGQPREIFDLVGKDATLFHHSTDGGPDSLDSQYVEQTQAWFDSMWTTVAHDIDALWTLACPNACCLTLMDQYAAFSLASLQVK